MSCKRSDKRLVGMFGALILGISGISVLLRAVLTLFFYDADVGYFVRGSILDVILYVLLAVTSVAAFAVCHVSKIAIEPIRYGECKTVNYLYAVPFAATLYFIISRTEEFSDCYRFLSEYSRYSSSSGQELSELVTSAWMVCISFLLAFFATVYFALAFFREKINRPFVSIFGIITAIWLLTVLYEIYFNMFVPMNSPNKTFATLSLISGAIFLVSETRLVLPYKKPRSHMFAAAFSVLFLSVSSIPTIIAHFSGAFGNSYSMGMDSIISLSLLFPASARLISFCFSKKTDETVSDTPAEEQSTVEITE